MKYPGKKSYVVIASLWLWGLVAQGAFVIPHAGTDAEKAALTARWTNESPWMGRYAQNIPAMITGTSELVPKLEADPNWQKLAAERPDPVNINVDVTAIEQRPVRAVKKDVANQWRAAIAEQIAAVERERPGALADGLVQKAASELAWVSGHDAKGLMTGVIQSLPAPERGAYFKIASVEEQFKALRESPGFNDDALKASFRGDAFGVTPDQISRQFIEGMIDDSIKRDAGLSVLLRAVWYIQRTNQDQMEAIARNPGDALNQARDTSLDPFNAPADQSKEFFDKVGHEAAQGSDNPNQALAKKISPYLQRLAKGQINEGNYEERMEAVPVVTKTFRVQEVSAEMGATRGYLMMDCSMQAYGFAYSPQEFVYLVSDPQGVPTGFIAATSVIGNGLKTLFVHDFGGQGVTVEMASHVLEGLYQALPQLGFQQMTFAAMNGNVGQYSAYVAPRTQAIKKNVAQQYLDGDMRAYIHQITKYFAQYDLATNAANLNPSLYEPTPEIASTTRVRVEGGGAGHVLADAPKSKPDAILRAIELFNANPEGGVTAEMMRVEGVQAQDLQALFYALRNPQGLPLEQYYGGLQDTFAKFEIKMSKNFVRDHDYLFWEGHLKAADATTSQDATLMNRTAEYTVLSMKRLPNPATALALLAKDKEFFLRSERFQVYLKSFTGHGPNEGPQLEKLMALGFEFDYLKQDGAALLRLVDGRSAAVRQWAIQGLQPEQLKALKPEVVRQIAADLDADDDHLPRAASKILLHTNNRDPEVIKELKVTVNEEEDEADVAARAALALIDIGEFGTGSVRRLRQNVRNKAIEPETRARMAAILRQLKEAKDPRYCNAMLEADNEQPDDA